MAAQSAVVSKTSSRRQRSLLTNDLLGKTAQSAALVHANLIKQMTGFAPLLLLDEVVAHLDPARREALYDALSSLGAQVWMTGADAAAFGAITDRARVFVVRSGTVQPSAGGFPN